MACTLRVGVLGTGNMGKNHVRVLSSMPQYELVGCYDSNSSAALEQAQRYGITAFDSPEAMYAAVDVVHVVVPSFLHKEYAIAAAAAGCHILVEKPIALCVEDAQAIIDAAKQAGVKLCVGHVERFNPAIITLSDILQDEEIISLDFKRLSPFDGRITDADVVQDLMIHDIDVLDSLVDSPITRIKSQGAMVVTKRLDYAQAMVSYENGVLASLTASRVTESKVRQAIITTRNAFIVVDYLNRTIEVSRKTNFTLDVGHPTTYKQENIIEKVFVPFKEPLCAEFEHFAACINDDLTPKTSGEMGKQALYLCERIVADACAQ